MSLDHVHLRAEGTSVLVDLADPAPAVLHWGRDLGQLSPDDVAAIRASGAQSVLHSAPGRPKAFTLMPTGHDAWSGAPAIEGHVGPVALTPRLRTATVDVDGNALTVALRDDEAGVEIEHRIDLDASGVAFLTARVTRDADADGVLDLTALRLLLPLPARAAEVLDHTGKWCREHAPQRRPLQFGDVARATRRGRPSHETPWVTAVGTTGFGYRFGEVWAVHVAWSGDTEWIACQLPEGAGVHRGVLGASELLAPGEIRLAPGESYESPRIAFAHSDRGTDGIGDAFHSYLRSRPGHPTSPRPLVLNSWEAVYFDHDEAKLASMARVAADLGVERFVLDDGWFLGRRAANAGLGDWHVDPDVWPNGLAGFASLVHDLGMEFGLWFEPEMVNPDSELARSHPEWILGPVDGPLIRNQLVLDLAAPAVWNLLFERITALQAEIGFDYIKWDHNRDLLAYTSQDGSPRAHAQTEALYRLLDAIREACPGLEIEACASGGGRMDLGILERTDRVWASDCSDPIERAAIHAGASLLLPPELLGAHVPAALSHTVARASDISSRLIMALFGHAGIETDPTALPPDELAALRAFAACYRELRPLIHSGKVVHADLPDPATELTGVVASDRGEALHVWRRQETSAATHSGRVPLVGLDPAKTYSVRLRTDFGRPRTHEIEWPSWFGAASGEGFEASGRILVELGLAMPTLNPGQAILLHSSAR